VCSSDLPKTPKPLSESRRECVVKYEQQMH